jgi:hypothetical protein
MALSNAERQAAWRTRREERLQELKRQHYGIRDLGSRLDPLFEQLFEEGQKNMATMSPGTVARLCTLIERLLVEHGIMRSSARSEKPQSYSRSMRARKARARSHVR